MANGRKVRSSEADELLREWEASGEAMSSWCARRGLSWYSLSAFKGWSVRGEVGFAEVVEQRPLEPITHGGRYRVEVGALVIEVGDDFRSETLQRLVRAVATC